MSKSDKVGESVQARLPPGHLRGRRFRLCSRLVKAYSCVVPGTAGDSFGRRI